MIKGDTWEQNRARKAVCAELARVLAGSISETQVNEIANARGELDEATTKYKSRLDNAVDDILRNHYIT